MEGTNINTFHEMIDVPIKNYNRFGISKTYNLFYQHDKNRIVHINIG